MKARRHGILSQVHTPADRRDSSGLKTRGSLLLPARTEDMGNQPLSSQLLPRVEVGVTYLPTYALRAVVALDNFVGELSGTCVAFCIFFILIPQISMPKSWTPISVDRDRHPYPWLFDRPRGGGQRQADSQTLEGSFLAVSTPIL